MQVCKLAKNSFYILMYRSLRYICISKNTFENNILNIGVQFQNCLKFIPWIYAK